MAGTVVVFGYGTAGRPIVALLAARGEQVRVAQRSRPGDLPAGVAHVACYLLDAGDVVRALEGATQAVLAVGFPYDARVWRRVWPRTMRNVVEGCAAARTRLVFVDNLYQLGRQEGPRTEEMSLNPAGEKAAVLGEVTHIWQAARERVQVAALRCSDFYGPEVGNSHLGASALGEIARGRRAQLLVPPDIPHDFVFVPDIARAVVTLLDAPDADYGQTWNMPCAPTRTPRELLAIGAASLGRRLRILAVPFGLLRPLGLVWRQAREVADVDFTWTRPYVVDGGKFVRRFGFVPTSFETGVPAAVRAFVGNRYSSACVGVESILDDAGSQLERAHGRKGSGRLTRSPVRHGERVRYAAVERK